MCRRQYFAEQMSHQVGCSLKVETGLAEMNFGIWGGKSFDALYQHDAQLIDRFWQNPWQELNLPPQGESIVAFESRVLACLPQWLEANAGKQLFFVTHGGVNRCLMAWALGVTRSPGFYRQLVIPYASIVKITRFADEAGAVYPQLHWG